MHSTEDNMHPLVIAILTRKLDEANELVKEAFVDISIHKLADMRKMVAAKMFAEVTMNSPATVNHSKEMRIDSGKQEYKSFSDKRGGSATANPEPRRNDPDPNKFRSNTPNVPQSDLRGSQDPKKQPFMKDGKIQRYKSQDVSLEEEQLDEARFRIVKTRIRGGKVQRRRKVSTVKGMTFRGGKLVRMSPAERRKRKMGAKRAKIKVKSKRSRMLQKRKRSMNKRRAMGLR
jgi:hypothetical protein